MSSTSQETALPRARLRSTSNGDSGAQALGWLSLGLGLAQVVAPGGVNRLIGAPDGDRYRKLMRTVGFREIASGLAILTQHDPAPGVKARVGGDLLDLALLGAAFGSQDAHRGRLVGATAAVLGLTALDVACSARLSATAGERTGEVHVFKTVTIKRSPGHVFDFWRNLANLPRFMAHLEEVQVLDQGRSRWRAKGPVGMHVTWEAEIVEDRPSESIGWCSLPGSDVPNWGRVNFRPAPGKRGTEVNVELHYLPPAGTLGRTVAKLFGEEPQQQLGDDLYRLKQVLEVGEVLRSDASPEGRMRSLLRQYPAQPIGGRS